MKKVPFVFWALMAFSFLMVPDKACSQHRKIELEKVKFKYMAPDPTAGGAGKFRPASKKILAFRIGIGVGWTPVEPYGKRIKPYFKGNEKAMASFKSFKTYGIASTLGDVTALAGALYFSAKLIKGDGSISSGDAIVGTSIFAGGIVSSIVFKSLSRSNMRKAVAHYNEALGLREPIKNREKRWGWHIEGAPGGYGLAVVTRF